MGYFTHKGGFFVSIETDLFEQNIVAAVTNSLVNTNHRLPVQLPDWLIQLGVRPNAIVQSVSSIGSSGSKTDIIIHCQNSEPIKISAKLSNADYFGNWYSHTRILNEFGEDIFNALTTACTDWANHWKHNTGASMFVGVSVCFGRRSGNTAQEFTDIFSYNDIVKIITGVGIGDEIANCLYVSSQPPNDIEDLIVHLLPINPDTLLDISSNFKVAHRPINPLTERSNRGKCIYTQFQPYGRLATPTVINQLTDLNQLGKYVPVEANSLNHNRLLNTLENEYNIIIPRR